MPLTDDELKTLKPYLDKEGRVTQWASPPKVKKLILKYLIENFEFGREYTEREVNDILNSRHTFGDHALLRREMYEDGYLNREPNGSKYWRTNTTFI
jgi:hypothetical protein